MTNVEILPQENILIYPNPSNNGVITIDLGSKTPPFYFQIFDQKGTLVFLNQNLTENKITIDLTNLSKGNYFVNAVNNKNSLSGKIIIE